MNSLVSVVVPTYNHASFLGRALQSVVSQTYPHWEVIVIDNHSNDDTDDVIRSQNESRIRLLKIHNDGVIAASRNLGIREAKGEWIAFLDSDDYWYPKKLEVVMAAAAADGACDTFCNDELMVDTRSGLKKVLRYGPYEPDFYRTLLVRGNCMSPSATVVRRNFLARHGLEFGESRDYITVEDYDLWLRMALAGARITFLGQVLGEYVVHGANNSSSVERQYTNGETLLRDHVFRIQQFEPSPERLWKQISPRLSLGRVRQYVADGKPVVAGALLFRTMAESPVATVRHVAARLRKRLRKSV